MNVSKTIRIAGLFVAAIAISVASSLVTSRILKHNSVSQNITTQGTPVKYASFTKVPSAFETDFTLAAEMSVHAVVHVKVKTPVQTQQQFGFPSDPFFEYFFGRPERQQQPQREAPMREGSGSGVIISEDGYIVTNNHVIDKSKEIEVTLNDNRTFPAKLVGADPNTDIALLKIEATELPVIRFGNSDSLKIGEWVLAVGNPLNLTSTVTAGIVSAKSRNIGINNAQMPIESFIQTDAAINPGNSGGALVNTRGELVGINTAIASQSGGFDGYGFAVPAGIVKKVVADMRQYGIVQRAMLGVNMRNIDTQLAKEKNLQIMYGAYVAQVVANSSAAEAGVKEGDIIIKINDMDIKSGSQLQEQIGRYSPGDKISLTVMRDNKPLTLKAELKNSRGNTAVVESEKGIDMLGAEFKALDDKTKTKLNLPYGVEIKTLKKGKLQTAGVKTGFIIVKINNQAIRSVDEIESALDEILSSADQFKMFSIVGIYPNGKIVQYAINLND
jgi:Do/DeqQ family serine protease